MRGSQSSYICLGYFIKYLDQQNYSKAHDPRIIQYLIRYLGNAYVSGMQEDVRKIRTLLRSITYLTFMCIH
jgi:hypothetical protein